MAKLLMLNRLQRLGFICITALLTACSSESNVKDQALPLAGSLIVWHPFVGEGGDLFNLSLEGYHQLNPNVQAISEQIPQTGMNQLFINRVRAGLGPDLMVIRYQDIPELVKAGVLKSLPDNALNLSKFVPSSLKQVRYGGKLYGFPLVSQTQVLCYNREQLTKSAASSGSSTQREVSPPTSIDGLISQAGQGYPVGIVSTFEDTFWGMRIFGGLVFDSNGRVQPQLIGWAKWLQWLKQAQDQPNVILNRDRNILRTAFEKGRLTYYVCDSSEIGDLKQDLGEKLGVALLPGKPNRPAGPLLYTRVFVFNRVSNPVQTQLGLNIVQFITNPDQQIKALLKSQTFIPVNRMVQIDKRLLPIEAVLSQQTKTAISLNVDDIESMDAIANKTEVLYQRVMAGDLSPDLAAVALTQIIKQEFYKPTEK